MGLTAFRPTAASVKALRLDLLSNGVDLQHVSTEALTKLLVKTGSIGVALDAMLMAKRPDWLRRIVGDGPDPLRRTPKGWPACEDA